MSTSPRGQAMVELALGMLLLVTVITVGIHFAEIGFITLKVEEAANFALFEATARPVHKIATGNWSVYRTAGTGDIARTQAISQNRYKDFDGRASVTGSTTLTQVFTRANGMTVTCQRQTGMPNITLSGSVTKAAAYGNASSENAGMSCSAEADIGIFKMPKKFLEGPGGIFNAKNWKRTTPIHVCSAGRASGTSCNGQFQISLDDWALQGTAGNTEGANCGSGSGGPVTSGCTNQAYFNLVQAAFPGVGGAGSDLASFTAGVSPTSESTFWMNFEGEDGPAGAFTSRLPSEELGNVTWNTTPYSNPGSYSSAYGSRNTCFLGRPCT